MTEKINILLLEDDYVLAKELREFLHSRDVICDVVYSGDLFFKQIKQADYAVFLLDINVPGINGLEICRQLRKANFHTPILILTAYGELEDKLKAFQMGADDYLVKPFHLEELFVRIESLYRRRNTPISLAQQLQVADLLIDYDSREVTRNKQTIALTAKEFKMLCLLAEAKGRVLSKQYIAERIWTDSVQTNQNTIEVYINFLRNKIDKPFATKLIHTKVGYGYYLKEME